MTYVREQTSEELAAQMKMLQKMPGWHDPLADRLWQEVETLCAELAGLRTGFDAQNEVIAGLRTDAERWRFVRKGDDRKNVTCMVALINRKTGMHVFVQDIYADTQTDIAMGKGG